MIITFSQGNILGSVLFANYESTLRLQTTSVSFSLALSVVSLSLIQLGMPRQVKMQSIAVSIYSQGSGSTVDKLQPIGSKWKSDLKGPVHGSISFIRGAGKVQFGSFKSARHGFISFNLFGEGRDVAVKQNISRGVGAEKPCLLPPQQLEKFIVELNVGEWAKALMSLVDDFMSRHDKVSGMKPSFLMPKMQFVGMALAVGSKSLDLSKAQPVFLLEPWLDEKEQGPFRKWMDNSSATPLEMGNGDDNMHAAYLAFAQHVQFVETHDLVFVADFQRKL